MKVLVTGGSGLVGQSLQERVKDENWFFLSSKDCDLRNFQEVDILFEKFSPDIVIHLASRVAGLYGNMANNFDFLTDNVKINVHVLECCKKYRVKKLINILSTCVFPDKDVTYPLTSCQILNGKPHDSNAGYSYSKRILYSGAKILSEVSDTQVVNLIPTNLYGENDNYDLESSHVIPGLIHKCYLAMKNNQKFEIRGSGSAKRQFLYASDLADVILKFVKSDNSKYVESIVSCPENKEITISQLVDKIAEIFQFSGDIFYNTQYSDGQHNKTTDSSEILSQFPSLEFTDIDIGLRKTIKFFVENYEILRK